MADYRLEPITELSRTIPAAPEVAEEEFHCPNCMFLGDEDNGFWACQNLCVRD